MITIRVQTDDFDSGAELSIAGSQGGGAVASFVGQVRGENGLTSMTLEHYPKMTKAALFEIAETACQRWSLVAVTIVHRIGQLFPGDRIVLVVTASSHRAAALEACNFVIDRLKTDAPFWKKEVFSDGRSHWVEQTKDDKNAAQRWFGPNETC